jgi:hypothetical protein
VFLERCPALSRPPAGLDHGFVHVRSRHRPMQYHLGFYCEYLAKFPSLCALQEAPNGTIMSYSG